MSKLILIDCDGVLLDWGTPFDAHMKELGHIKHNSHAYSIAESYRITPEVASSIVEEFNSSRESYRLGYLSAIADSRRFVERLVVNGYRFVVISSVSGEEFSATLRRFNLSRRFGHNAFDAFHILPCGSDKTEVLKLYVGKAKYWIEDNLKNAEIGAELGFTSLLLDYPYNRSKVMKRNVIRCSNWQSIYYNISR